MCIQLSFCCAIFNDNINRPITEPPTLNQHLQRPPWVQSGPRSWSLQIGIAEGVLQGARHGNNSIADSSHYHYLYLHTIFYHYHH